MNSNRTWQARVYKCDGPVPYPYLAMASCAIGGVEYYAHESSRPEARMALVSASDFARQLNLLHVDPASRKDDMYVAAELPPGRFLTVPEANAEPRRALPGFDP